VEKKNRIEEAFAAIRKRAMNWLVN